MILSCKEDPRLREFLSKGYRNLFAYLWLQEGRGRWMEEGENGDPHKSSCKWPVISYPGLNDNGQSLVDFLRENYPEALL